MEWLVILLLFAANLMLAVIAWNVAEVHRSLLIFRAQDKSGD